MTDPIPFRHQGASPSGGSDPRAPRVAGSGFTVFHWQGQVIGWAQTIGHSSPQPVAPPAVLQPMDQRYPLSIVTPAAIGPGTLQLAMYEQYGRNVWDDIMSITDTQFPGGANVADPERGGFYNDLAEVFMRLANIDPAGGGVKCTRMIYPPSKAMGDGAGGAYTGNKVGYARTYVGCVITDIRDDEQIDIGSMLVTKSITIQYRYAFDSKARPNYSELYSTSS